MRLGAALAVAACAAALLAACGADGRGGEVRLVVTEQFGALNRGERTTTDLPDDATAQSLYAPASGPGWFAFVNGIGAERGSDDAEVHGGDTVWLDRHAPGPAKTVPAVVGSFPEPFRNGIAGKRLPVRIECEQTGSPACDEARARLAAAGIKAGDSVLGVTSGGRVLRVLVGRWPALRRTPEVQEIEEGPARSGVFARMTPSGARLTALDPQGRPARAYGAGTGLVAATRGETIQGDESATWVVTGTDDAGVLAAAKALEQGVLGNRYALAISPDGLAVPLPAVR